MNRAEKRRAQKVSKKQSNVYTLTQAQIDKIKDDAVMEASSVAVMLMLAIPVMILHDKYWVKTAKRKIPLFVDQCLDLYTSFSEGRVTLEDLHKCLEEESGIKILGDRDGK